MATYVFGNSAANKKYLRVFVETACYSGMDVVLIGDPVPSFFPLNDCKNIFHIHITWDELIDRVSEHVFHGAELSQLRQADPYKVNDLKPLFGYLFPEFINGYDFWGTMDNDLVIGNLRNWFTSEFLNECDIISPLNEHSTWGPFTLYRNDPRINELFWRTEIPLVEVLNTKENFVFDEWGNDKLGYNSSMSGIIQNHGEKLGIRSCKRVAPIRGDGDCYYHNATSCKACLYTKDADRPLWSVNDDICASEVLLCHYRMGKHRIENAFKISSDGITQILNAQSFRLDSNGFYLNSKTCKRAGKPMEAL